MILNILFIDMQNVIISSGANNANLIRSPYDIINLYPLIYCNNKNGSEKYEIFN